MCQNKTSVQDAKGKTPLNPMGYDISLGLLENICKDVNRLNVQQFCARPRMFFACSVPARPAWDDELCGVACRGPHHNQGTQMQTSTPTPATTTTTATTTNTSLVALIEKRQAEPGIADQQLGEALG